MQFLRTVTDRNHGSISDVLVGCSYWAMLPLLFYEEQIEVCSVLNQRELEAA